MACRDYDYDYQAWLQRGREHLDRMTEMLRQLCQTAAKASLELPPSVAQWCSTPPSGNAVPLSKEVFDQTAQMLCLMCQAAEKQSLALPPSVAAWWAEHKARDGQPEDFAKGLDPSPGGASFWEEHAARLRNPDEVPGVHHLDAVRALAKAGFRVLRQGKWITLTDDQRQVMIPRQDPVNAFAMARIIQIAGLSEKEFRNLL